MGLRLVWQPHPLCPALYAISIRRLGSLPAASFRFHLTMDTLAVQLTLPTTKRVVDFHHQVIAHGGRTLPMAGVPGKAPAHCCAGAVCFVGSFLTGTVRSGSNQDHFVNRFLKKLMICLKNSMIFCQNGICPCGTTPVSSMIGLMGSLPSESLMWKMSYMD